MALGRSGWANSLASPPPPPFGYDMNAVKARQKTHRELLIEIIMEHETYLYNGDEGVGRVSCHGCAWVADEQLLINSARHRTGELYAEETLETLAAKHLAVEIEKAGFSRG